MVERTENPAYDTAMKAVQVGEMFACIPVVFQGETGVWTAQGTMPPPVNDLDVLAQAFFCCRRAYDEAERAGAHAVG